MTAGPRGSWRLVRARPVPVPASVSRFAKRARRRRLRAAMPWLFAAGVVTFAGVSLGLLYFTNVFAVSRVTVTGTAVTTPDAVREAAAIRVGTPLIRVDLASAARRVEQVPAVAQARVRRDWPGALVIQVVERTAVAVVPTRAGLVGVDRAGVAFLPFAGPTPGQLGNQPSGLPVVRLDRPGPDDPTTRAALTVLTGLPDGLRSPLAELVAEAPTRIRLELHGGRTVIWGDASENEEKATVALSLLAGQGTVIDVSAPRFVTVR